ncbi:MAG: hypothetical protein LRY73_10255 [Bacillus sp. (in: Bacteria)]|nr:hypothetical protein [Bacillus sp. (in: firmicutes)]
MVNEEKKSSQGQVIKEKRLKGILWDLIRLQLKISTTALVISFFLLLTLQSLVPKPFLGMAGAEESSEVIYLLLDAPIPYISLFLIFFLFI